MKPTKKRGRDADWVIKEFGGSGVKDATAKNYVKNWKRSDSR